MQPTPRLARCCGCRRRRRRAAAVAAASDSHSCCAPAPAASRTALLHLHESDPSRASRPPISGKLVGKVVEISIKHARYFKGITYELDRFLRKAKAEYEKEFKAAEKALVKQQQLLKAVQKHKSKEEL